MSTRANLHPFKPTKGIEYKIYIPLSNSSASVGLLNVDVTSNTFTATVSKDGGSYASCSNSVVTTNIGSKGVVSLILTASEMDADVVIVNIDTSSSVEDPILIIHTTEESGADSGGLAQDDLVDGRDIVPLSNPTIGDVLKAFYWYVRRNKYRKG